MLPHERRPGDVALTKTLLSHVDTVITHSAGQAAQARELAPGATVLTARIPPHLPVTDHQNHEAERTPVPAPAHCRLLFFGIVRPYKGLDVLLRALAGAPAHVTLTVAGEFWGGTEQTEKLIADLGLRDRVTLRPGYVPATAIPALFAAADALVMPYREATASQNALLAFAHGVPVITTTAGALAERGTRRRGRADLRAGRRRGPAPRADPDQRPADGPAASFGCQGRGMLSRCGLPICRRCWQGSGSGNPAPGRRPGRSRPRTGRRSS